jgi:hypothetical protein
MWHDEKTATLEQDRYELGEAYRAAKAELLRKLEELDDDFAEETSMLEQRAHILSACTKSMLLKFNQ